MTDDDCAACGHGNRFHGKERCFHPAADNPQHGLRVRGGRGAVSKTEYRYRGTLRPCETFGWEYQANEEQRRYSDTLLPGQSSPLGWSGWYGGADWDWHWRWSEKAARKAMERDLKRLRNFRMRQQEIVEQTETVTVDE